MSRALVKDPKTGKHIIKEDVERVTLEQVVEKTAQERFDQAKANKEPEKSYLEKQQERNRIMKSMLGLDLDERDR